MLFTIEVQETRHYAVEYTVEAESFEEAIEKAEKGETVIEEDLRLVGILNRRCDDEPEMVRGTEDEED